MLMFRDKVDLDPCYPLVVLKGRNRSLKGSSNPPRSGFLALEARGFDPRY